MARTRTRSFGGLCAIRFKSPLSGLTITLREPTGADDLLLAEYRGDDPHLPLRLVERLAEAETDVDWGEQAVFDIDTLILRLRQAVFGDRVRSHVTCAGCGGQAELSFEIETYLAHHRPHEGPLQKRSWGVLGPDDAGWRRLTGADGIQPRFRLPTLNDQIAVAGAPDAPLALAQRCVEPHPLPAKLAACVETALGAYAPPLAGPLRGHCPDCGAGDRGAFRSAAILPTGAQLPRAVRLRRRRHLGRALPLVRAGDTSDALCAASSIRRARPAAGGLTAWPIPLISTRSPPPLDQRHPRRWRRLRRSSGRGHARGLSRGRNAKRASPSGRRHARGRSAACSA